LLRGIFRSGHALRLGHDRNPHHKVIVFALMKSMGRSSLKTSLLILAFSALPAAVMQAHPGHYHPPGEEDEFDALRADWLHLHGGLEIFLALSAVAAVVVFAMGKSKAIRVGAALAFTGALTAIVAF
jgi:hypothetical protein